MVFQESKQKLLEKKKERICNYLEKIEKVLNRCRKQIETDRLWSKKNIIPELQVVWGATPETFPCQVWGVGRNGEKLFSYIERGFPDGHTDVSSGRPCNPRPNKQKLLKPAKV